MVNPLTFPPPKIPPPFKAPDKGSMSSPYSPEQDKACGTTSWLDAIVVQASTQWSGISRFPYRVFDER